MVQARANPDIPSGCLQSVDDQEATYRKKGSRGFKGYVANLTESCTPGNELQLITQVQVASNNREDADLLAESLPDLKARTGLESLYVDGGYGSPAADQASLDQQVELVSTGIRGNTPDPDKFNLSNFKIRANEKGKPLQMTCPNGQTVAIEAGRTTGFVAHFTAAVPGMPLLPEHLPGPGWQEGPPPQAELHPTVSLAWLSIAMLLYGVQSMTLFVTGSAPFGLAPLHALTIGFFASMILAMASRVTLGHSGRELVADAVTWALFLGFQLAATARIAPDLLGLPASLFYPLAAGIWLAAYGLWFAKYGPLYWRPRIDHKPG